MDAALAAQKDLKLITYNLQLKKQEVVSYNSRRNGRGFACAKELKTYYLQLTTKKPPTSERLFLTRITYFKPNAFFTLGT